MLVLRRRLSTAEHEELNSVECRVAQMHTCLLLLLFRQTNNLELDMREDESGVRGGEVSICMGENCCEL